MLNARACSPNTSPKTYNTNSLQKSISNSINSFPLEFVPLLRLTSVSPPALFLLISTHACSQCNINAWRCGKAETLCHFNEVELLNIKYRPQTMRRIRLKIGTVPVFRRLRIQTVSLRRESGEERETLPC